MSGVAEVASLERSLEQMRQALASTTISRDYLDDVLNGMSDAVLVTSPDGGSGTVLEKFPTSIWGGSRESCSPQLDWLRAIGPVWSPDGQQVAAVYANRLYVVSRDGTDVRVVMDPIERSLGGIGMGLAWRPEI